MPLYEYRCPQCGPFDVRRTLEEASTPLSCPTCTAPARRVYTASRYGEPERAPFRRGRRRPTPGRPGALR